MMTPRKVAVLGAGSGALCWAGNLAGRGADVVLAARTPGALEDVASAGAITIGRGGEQATVRVEVVDSPVEAIRRAQTVVLCVPADRLPGYRDEVLGALTTDHDLILSPGNTGGALYLGAQYGLTPPFGLAELNTLPFVARKTGPAAVRQFATLRHVYWAGLGHPQGDRLARTVTTMLPGAIRVPSVLQTALTNFNPVIHPPVMLLNAGRIESQGAFRWYSEGSTPSAGRLMEALDEERMSVQVAFGLEPITFRAFFDLAGYSPDTRKGLGIADTLRGSRANASILGPSTLHHRFLDEDVPFGLVPMAALAAWSKTAAPITDAVIALSEVVTGKDYVRNGFNAEALGLDRLVYEEHVHRR